VPTTLRLSQLCHGCSGYRAKPPSLRVHCCACGIGPVQRDAYSAWLALFATPGPQGSQWSVDVVRARSAWTGAGLRLPATSAVMRLEDFSSFVAQVASGDDVASPLGTERLAGEAGAISDEARNVVGQKPRVRASLKGRRRTDVVAASGRYP
jgi:hypothetical protein